MQTLKILIGGTTEELRLERDALVRAVHSVRIATARVEITYSDAGLPREQSAESLRACDMYLAVYAPTRGGWIASAERLAALGLEIVEAARLEKPLLVLVQNLPGEEQAATRHKELLQRALETTEQEFDLVEYADLAQLQDQATSALTDWLVQKRHLTASRSLFQAPLPLDTFVGRAAKLQEVCEPLIRGEMVLLHGLGDFGGLGKTELAIQAAHRLRDVFTDGVLWANIQTARPDDLLISWAREFGGVTALGRGDLRFEFRPVPVEVRKIEETAVRADILRDLLRDKRVLVILDGVVDEVDSDKIAPIARGIKNCAVLVTSRARRLTALPDTRPVDLDRMSEDEAWEVFTRIAGAERLSGQRASFSEIGRLLDLTPLALNSAACQLSEQPTLTLAALTQLLQAERTQLEKLNWGYPRARGNRAAINLSYKQLNADEKKVLMAVGAFAGNDFNASAVAYVAETPFSPTQDILERLERLALVQQRHRPGRYQLHPVVKSFTREKLFDPVENQGQHSEAELRMANYFCAIAKDYGRKLQDTEIHTALAILDSELSNIFAGQKWARTRNDKAGWELCRDYISGAMTYYFSLKAMWSDWIAWSNTGIEACQKLGDERNSSAIAGSLGMVYFRKGEMDQANEFYKHAVDTMEKIGNLAGLATIYMNLGNVQTQKREWNAAISYLLKSLQIRERLGDLHGQAQSRANIGMLYAKRGEKDKARANWIQALEIFDHLGSEHEADIVRKWLKNLPLGRT